MMTLIDVLNRWTTRYALTRGERIDIGSMISMRLDRPGMKLPPLPVRMAEKMGAYTYDVLIERFMAERLAPDTERPPPPMEAALASALGETAVPESPKSWVLTDDFKRWEKPARPTAGRKCGGCRELGHRWERCPNNPTAKNPIGR
jgi:hypothetical protein